MRDGVRRPAGDRTRLIAGSALALAVFLSLILLARPLVRGDGLAYYMWLEPISYHFSFDLTPAAEQFAAVNEYQIFQSPTGAYATAFSFGPALLLSPWYRLGSLLPDATAVDHAHYAHYQAEPFIRSFFVMLGVVTYLVLASLLAYRTALALTGAPWASAFAAFALVWGTPLIYYGTVEPYMAHAVGAFVIALAVWLYTRPKVPWLGLGVTLSAAVLVRWQLALLAVPIGLHLAWGRRWRDLGLLVAGTASLAWLVPLSWHRMFDDFLVVPAAVQNMRPFLGPPVHALHVLFSPERGLFVWSPLVLLAVIGLIWLWRREPRLAGVGLAAIAIQTLINGGVSDWAAGWSYGMRRMSELYPLFVLGLACLLARPGRAGRLAWGAAAVLLAATGVLFLAHLTYINVEFGAGASAPEEVRYWFGTLDNPRLTWFVIKDHYGPWAWVRPGP